MSAGRQHAVALATGAAVGAAARQHAVALSSTPGAEAVPTSAARQHAVSLSSTPGGARGRQHYVKLDIVQGARRIVIDGALRILTRKPRTPSTGPVNPGAWQWGAVRPDATNTGAKTPESALPVSVGDVIVTTAGAIIENRYIKGRILVRAANVVVRNCVVETTQHYSSDTACIDANSSSCINLLVEDTMLRQGDDPWFWVNGMIGSNYTARRVHAYDVVDGFGVYKNYGDAATKSGPTNVTIEGCYVHDVLAWRRTAADAAADPANGPKEPHSDDQTHNDGIQIQGGSGTIIRGNAIIGTISRKSNFTGVFAQCVAMTPNVSAISGVVIDTNWVDGGVNAAFIAITSGAFPGASNIGVIRRNREGRIGHFRFNATQPSIRIDSPLTFSEISDNRFWDNLALVPVSAPGYDPSKDVIVSNPPATPTGLGLAPLGTSPLGV